MLFPTAWIATAAVCGVGPDSMALIFGTDAVFIARNRKSTGNANDH